MLFSHHFGSQETLNRARYWLTWHGFEVQDLRRTGDSTAQSHRLAVQVSFSKAAAARALIDSIELADPAACPSLLEASTMKHWRVDPSANHASLGSSRPTGTPIHWHPREESSSEATVVKTSEYMLSRWE